MYGLGFSLLVLYKILKMVALEQLVICLNLCIESILIASNGGFKSQDFHFKNIMNSNQIEYVIVINLKASFAKSHELFLMIYM